MGLAECWLPNEKALQTELKVTVKYNKVIHILDYQSMLHIHLSPERFKTVEISTQGPL